MNHYAAALAQLQGQPDHQLKQIGDQWQTPKPLAWGLFHHFAPTLGPVVLDMFADDCNALLPNYYDAEDNALTQELAADLRRLGGAAYANPPYSRPCVDEEGQPITGMDAILTFCREQREQGARIMMLIKAATSETWWPEDADFIQFIAGRIGFNTPDWYNPRDPRKDKPSSSGFASAVVIFDASWQGERRPIARLRRDDLITTGTIILDMINRQAVELTLAAKQTIEIAAKTQSDHFADVSKMVQAELYIQDAELHTQGNELHTQQAEEQGEANTKPLADWAWDYQNDHLNLGGAVWHRFVVVLTVLYGQRDIYTSREVAIAISLSDAQLRDEFTTMPNDERQRLERIINAMDTLEWNSSGAQQPLTDPLRQAAAAAIFVSLKETADAPKHDLLDRAIAAIASLEEEVA